MEITLEALLEQENVLQFIDFTNKDALAVGLFILEIAKEKFDKGIAVHIERDEYPLFTHYMDGTSDRNLYWVNAKKNVVKLYGNSSLYMDVKYNKQGIDFHEATGLPSSDYQAAGGSFPLIVRGQGRIGTITVSGLTGEEDHELAVEGIKKFLGIE
ncbi:MAG: hypothetical protein K0S76_1574 [Herbinix sp.]|jgi:uncharacterized protein (UPF0303 family)|nr:hypothetical protein [Herbinix sp.]